MYFTQTSTHYREFGTIYRELGTLYSNPCALYRISIALYSTLYWVLLHFIGFTVHFTDTLWRFRRHRKVTFLEPCFFGHTKKFKGLLSFPSSSHRYALNSKHEKYFFSEGIFFLFSQKLVTGGGKNCFHNL